MLVLDTDHISWLERVESPQARHLQGRLDRAAPEEVAVTIISYEEQIRGRLAYLARARTMIQRIEAYRLLRSQFDNYRRMAILDFDELSATRFQNLVQARLRVGTMDLMIAAIVLRHDATLLSRNLRDFRRVPGLKVEDWTL